MTSHSRVVCRIHQHRKVVRAVRVEAHKQVCLSGRRYPRPTATEVRIRNGGRIVYASLQQRLVRGSSRGKKEEQAAGRAADTMALEELSTTVSKLTFNIFGSESEKKVGT